MKLSNIQAKMLKELTDLHAVPSGAFSVRVNGQTLDVTSTAEIVITPHTDKAGFRVDVKAGTVGKSLHIPVLIDDKNLDEEVLNDFFIEAGCDILIVAGCGIHGGAQKKARHAGVHTFHVGKSSRVRYVERHLGIGEAEKDLSPITNIFLEEGAEFLVETVQLGGVDNASRKTTATLGDGAVLCVKEKILTDGDAVASSDFVANLVGKNCKCEIISRAVAKGQSRQTFASVLNGHNACWGRVECDGILLDEAKISSAPQVVAACSEAELSHEAQVGKIANDQLVKLMTLGLSQKEAEDKIIGGYLSK